MDFSYFTLVSSPSPEADFDRIQDQIALAKLAEALDFRGIWLTEHYFTGESVYCDALTFAAALATQTTRLRIGFAVVQLPFHHPVRLATQLALLDNLSRGRIDVGVGKGTVYNEFEFVGHGLRSGDARDRMAEAQDILQRCFTATPFQHEGRYYQVGVPALRPKPVQQPGPPIWRSVVSPASFSECGRAGLPILTTRLPVARIPERWTLYAEGLAASSLAAEAQALRLRQAGVWRNVYVAESDAQAEDALATALTETRRHMMHIRGALNPSDFKIDPAMLNLWSDPDADESTAIRDVMATGSLYGSPAHVRGQIEELRDAGVGHIVCQTAFGDMPFAKASQAMRLFGEQVMPAFRDPAAAASRERAAS